MKPDFLIIGAAKSATSWLAQSLRGDAGFFLPKPEIHYFSRHFDRPMAWYEEFFAEAAPGQTIGEKSNSYLSDAAAAARIRDALPGVKLIAVLRDPIDRAYSAFCMQLDRGKISADIERHLDPARTTVPHTLTDGLYHEKLAPYRALFPDALHVITYEDMFGDPATLAGVGTFLGHADPGALRPVGKRVNAKKTDIGVPRWLKRTVWPIVKSEEVRRPLMLAAKKLGVVGLLSRTAGEAITYPPLDDGLRERLRAYYREDVARLEDDLGRDLGHWLAPRPAVAA